MTWLRPIASLILVIFFMQIGPINGDEVHKLGHMVHEGDADLGRALDDFVLQGPVILGYYDTGSNPNIYDEADTVYLHFGASSFFVSPNDIRLTKQGVYPEGSKVKFNDADMGKQLTFLPSGSAMGFYYIETGNKSGFDNADWVYIKASSFNIGFTSTNDIRLRIGCDVNVSKIRDFDWDQNMPLIDLVSCSYPLFANYNRISPVRNAAQIRFFNYNGNMNYGGFPIYDYEDDVYLDVPYSDSGGIVSVNDMHLSN